MTLPTSIDPSTPAGSSARSLGDDQIRALKQAIIDLFGLPSATSITGQLMTVGTNGSVLSINLATSGVKIDKVDATDLNHLLAGMWLRGQMPYWRFIGDETNARDWRIGEEAGVFAFYENTGTTNIPIWSKRLIIGSTSGNIMLTSGTGFLLELDHVITADRVLTLPDATDTLVARLTTEKIRNKAFEDITEFKMAGTNPITPASAPAGTPPINALFSDNLIKAWVLFNGTGTPAIRRAYNITGIVDNGTGDYTLTIDQDFIDTQFGLVGFAMDSAGNARYHVAGGGSAFATGSARLTVQSGAGTLTDVDTIFVALVGLQ